MTRYRYGRTDRSVVWGDCDTALHIECLRLRLGRAANFDNRSTKWLVRSSKINGEGTIAIGCACFGIDSRAKIHIDGFTCSVSSTRYCNPGANSASGWNHRGDQTFNVKRRYRGLHRVTCCTFNFNLSWTGGLDEDIQEDVHFTVCISGSIQLGGEFIATKPHFHRFIGNEAVACDTRIGTDWTTTWANASNAPAIHNFKCAAGIHISIIHNIIVNAHDMLASVGTRAIGRYTTRH